VETLFKHPAHRFILHFTIDFTPKSWIEGLKINKSKTKYMIAAGYDRTISGVRQSVTFGDKTIELVKLLIWDLW
jgi:aconitase B